MDTISHRTLGPFASFLAEWHKFPMGTRIHDEYSPGLNYYTSALCAEIENLRITTHE